MSWGPAGPSCSRAASRGTPFYGGTHTDASSPTKHQTTPPAKESRVEVVGGCLESGGESGNGGVQLLYRTFVERFSFSEFKTDSILLESETWRLSPR